MLYIYMGSETFVDVQNDGGYANGPITVGYSTSRLQSLFIGEIRLTNGRRVYDQRKPQYLMGLESQHIGDVDKHHS